VSFVVNAFDFQSPTDRSPVVMDVTHACGLRHRPHIDIRRTL